MYNLSAELAEHLKVFSEFINSRASVHSPEKMEVPMVWDMYMDTTRPVGTELVAEIRSEYQHEPIAFSPLDFGEQTVAQVTYQTAASGDMDMLGLINDRLKTQARRYPHPISNEMEVIG